MCFRGDAESSQVDSEGLTNTVAFLIGLIAVHLMPPESHLHLKCKTLTPPLRAPADGGQYKRCSRVSSETQDKRF